MEKLAIIWNELLIADAQPDDWMGWVTNQAGHMALWGIPATMFLLWMEFPSYIVPAMVGLSYLLVWELAVQGGKDSADSIMDTFMVTCGAVFVIALMSDLHEAIRVFTIFAGALAYGVWMRV